MTRECDASRHHASEQYSGLTWNQVHSEETYERTSHNFGRHLSAGLSLDLGGAMISIGTGGRYNEYGPRPYGYGANYGSGVDYGYPQSSLYYPNRSNYGYNDSSYAYNGYANNGYFNNYNSSDSGRYYSGPSSYQHYAQGSYDYNQSYQNQLYYPYSGQNYADGDQYDRGYQYRDQYSSGTRYSSSDYYSNRYSAANNFDSNAGDDCNYGNPFDLSSRRSMNSGDGRFDNRYSNYSNYNNYSDDGGYEYNVGPQSSRYYSQDRYSDYRYQNNYRNQNDHGYQVDYGYQNGYSNYGNGNDWQRMRVTLQSMLGSAPSDYNRSVPDDLGCATVVSAALRRCYGLRINDTNVDGLESSLRRNGFEAVPVQDAQPGDTIIAHRRNGRHGHTAIYVGDGKIVNNSSSRGKVVVGSLSSFASRDYESVVAYRKC